MKYIIADIDNTITIVGNRFNLLPDYKSFHERCNEDLPNIYVIDLLMKYDAKIIFITMRPESVRDITCELLDKYFTDYILIMKPIIDSVSAKEFKYNAIEEYNVKDILFAIDDNKHVINMYASAGINCLQVVNKNSLKHKRIIRRKR